MPEIYRVQPCGPVVAEIRPPGSKSITNRALIIAALARGNTLLQGALFSQDTRVMIDNLRLLGLQVTADEAASTIQVCGAGQPIHAVAPDLWVENSGTTMRFLAAMVSLGKGEFRLDGTPRMRQRPVADLLDGLRQLGVAAISEAGNGCPPILIRANGMAGGTATIRGDVSSQFLSGLLLAAPLAQSPVTLHIDGPLVSEPYVKMTLDVMAAFGVDVCAADLKHLHVPAPVGYTGREYSIEPDASAASYFLAAAALTGGKVTIPGLHRQAMQGDVRFADLLEQMGCDVHWGADSLTVQGKPLSGITVDMNDISDTVQTLAAVALFAKGSTTVTGVGHIRHKETDRLSALATELQKLGATVEERPDGLTITPGPLHAARIATYDDHRMAMSLALVGLRVPGVEIEDPACTGKTYPRFFSDLERVTGTA